MRIIRQSDTVFRRRANYLSDAEWIQKVRHSPELDNYTMEDHEAAQDAHDLGFQTVRGGWNHRLYKVDDHGVIYEIYPRGHRLHPPETDEEIRDTPPWMMKVSNIPESPDVLIRHNTLDDALDMARDKSWMRGVYRPKYDTYSEETKRLPTGTPFVTPPFARMMDPAYGDISTHSGGMGDYLKNRDKTIKTFHDAWDEGTHDPYARQDFGKWG